jgi:hypothetical protein
MVRVDPRTVTFEIPPEGSRATTCRLRSMPWPTQVMDPIKSVVEVERIRAATP